MNPDLKLGLQDIGKMHMGTFRTAKRLSKMKIVDQKFKKFCPCSNLCVPDT
ncbi:hypothetical protein AYI70_g4818, partial [Smittium culicis]